MISAVSQGIFWGAGVGLVSGIALKWAIPKPPGVFTKVFYGGMAFRFAAFVLMAALLYRKGTGFTPVFFAFVATMILAYLIELAWIFRGLRHGPRTPG